MKQRKKTTVVFRASECEEVVAVLKKLADISQSLGHFEDARFYRIQAAIYLDRLYGRGPR